MDWGWGAQLRAVCGIALLEDSPAMTVGFVGRTSLLPMTGGERGIARNDGLEPRTKGRSIRNGPSALGSVSEGFGGLSLQSAYFTMLSRCTVRSPFTVMFTMYTPLSM